ncbi:MAG: hypothetical protein CMP24_02960 [Rickettsiales bacterium]|nr:hypothetical protein [Rickettsiales bacterium]
MNNKDLSSNFYDDMQEKSESPLSEKELASLIKASKASSFKAKEIKKEMKSNFKKLSLHEIAKKAQEKKIQKDLQNKLLKNNEESDLKTKKNVEDEENIDKHTDEIKSKNQEVEEEKNLKEKIDSEIENDTDENKKKHAIEEEFNINKEEYELQIEEAKKTGYEDGRKKAFSEIKEGADAAVATLKNMTDELSKVDNFDLSELEKMITDKILELSTELSGKIIKALPADFLKKIKEFAKNLENIEGKIDIFISDADYKILEKNKDTKKEISNLNISSLDYLNTGELEFKVNGVKILSKIKEAT